MLYDNILGSIGNTPLVRLTAFSLPEGVEIYAKLEGQNPGGSVKDRIALSMIGAAEKSGVLTKAKIILESTSGNTGIGLALVGAVKGYKVVLTMSAGMSEERKKILRAFGARLIETNPAKGTGGAIEKAQQLFAQNPGKYWMPHQHGNPANSDAHYHMTAEEILEDLPGITHFVAGIGTFGTLSGVGTRLREYNPDVKIIGVEPKLGEAIQGLRNMQEPFAPELFDESLLDEKLIAQQSDAYRLTRELAANEGLLVGVSSGAALWGALHLAKKISKGQIVVLFPDRGEKYLSTDLFV